MGKRSDYERAPRDYYPTPLAAVNPLVPHLPAVPFVFSEPCAGDGRLITHIESLTNGECTSAYDIEPLSTELFGKRQVRIQQMDARDLTKQNIHNFTDKTLIITNPPWGRQKKHDYILHTLIETFANIAPTWLLFDADWIHTIQSKEYVDKYLTKIVSIGRVKWIENSAGTGKDNCCWYEFRADKNGPTQFYGR